MVSFRNNKGYVEVKNVRGSDLEGILYLNDHRSRVSSLRKTIKIKNEFKGLKLPTWYHGEKTVLEIIADELNSYESTFGVNLEIRDLQIEIYDNSDNSEYNAVSMIINDGEINYKRGRNIQQDISTIFHRRSPHVTVEILAEGLIGNPNIRARKEMESRINGLGVLDSSTVASTDDMSKLQTTSGIGNGIGNYGSMLSNLKYIRLLNDVLKIGRDMEDNLDELVGKSRDILRGEVSEFYFLRERVMLNLTEVEWRVGDDNHPALGLVHYSNLPHEVTSATKSEDYVTFNYGAHALYRKEANGIVMNFEFKADIKINYGISGLKIEQDITNPYVIITFKEGHTQREVLDIIREAPEKEDSGIQVELEYENSDLVVRMRYAADSNTPNRDKYRIFKGTALKINQYLSSLGDDRDNDSAPKIDLTVDDGIETPIDAADSVVVPDQVSS